MTTINFYFFLITYNCNYNGNHLNTQTNIRFPFAETKSLREPIFKM